MKEIITVHAPKSLVRYPSLINIAICLYLITGQTIIDDSLRWITIFIGIYLTILMFLIIERESEIK